MQERYIASADLGTSKIALTVAKVTGNDVQVIYYRESPSDGVRNSSVFNPQRASEALGKAVTEAAKELGIEMRQMVTGLPRYSVHQETASARVERDDPDSCITQEEIDNLKSMALDSYPLEDGEKEVIYGAVAQSFSTEDIFQGSEEDIVGATSSFVEGNFKIFVGDLKALKNANMALTKIGIAPAGNYFLPDAAGQAILTDEEKDNGVALIEMGAGVTSLSIYQGRIMRYYASIPFGGRNITTDIKYECGFKENLAENIKLAYGACMPEKLLSMSEKIIQITDEENGTYGQKLPVKYLSEIITCRASEIIEAILFLIQESGYSEKLRSGIVMTGGGANLANLGGLVKEMSGYKIRTGFPHRFSTEGCNGICETSAAASVGMILMAKKDQNLNCTSRPKEKADVTKQEQPTVEQDLKDTVFERHDAEPQPVKPQKTKKRDNQGTMKVFWKKVGRKVDDFVGNLYDETDENYGK